MQIKLSTTGPYTVKDQLKANLATKFIGRGSMASSTAQYARDFGALANCGKYVPSDVVFVSVEGNRRGRSTLDKLEVDKAIKVGAWFVADNRYNRERQYNIGERELSDYLTQAGYTVSDFTTHSLWKPA